MYTPMHCIFRCHMCMYMRTCTHLYKAYIDSKCNSKLSIFTAGCSYMLCTYMTLIYVHNTDIRMWHCTYVRTWYSYVTLYIRPYMILIYVHSICDTDIRTWHCAYATDIRTQHIYTYMTLCIRTYMTLIYEYNRFDNDLRTWHCAYATDIRTQHWYTYMTLCIRMHSVIYVYQCCIRTWHWQTNTPYTILIYVYDTVHTALMSVYAIVHNTLHIYKFMLYQHVGWCIAE